MRKTLVVDDSVMMRRLMRSALKQINITDVAEAENGRMALDILMKGAADFELIVCDWTMPDMTGIELLKACKIDESMRRIPFVMVTAEAQRASMLEAIYSGVDDYVVKPFTPNKLQEAIQKAKDRIDRS